MKRIIFGLLLLCTVTVYSQQTDTAKTSAWKKIYRATPTKINDLVNTKLDVKFDFSKSWMYGKAWITLHPHFYPTDSLTLDARYMNIKDVSVMKAGKLIPLKYRYDSLRLFVNLDKTYKGGENYTVFIDYIAMPEKIKGKGSRAISDDKGLYFINPLGKDKNKPTEIWTQGETESNSGWVPTIDKPNQRQTDEISITVPDKYKTLSNGLLVKTLKNADGTRTDTWKMNLPHAPYLMMMAIGDYAVIKDSYKGKEVSYYVEKEYAPVARKIFGLTPEMISYYSQITGVDFPWQKYSQVVVRDYVSGAMENTTATVHGEGAQQDARQLIDENAWEDVISHELFHQWFGDYVTCESWSNLTVNESFADFSEIMWIEHKHGKDAAAAHNYNSMLNYIQGGNEKKDLVRFYYKNREDVFDLVSYQKGGRILNMLRNYVGDSAFFKSIHLYLQNRKFNSAEAQDLRLAFEDVTGRDLSWFWNQWYYGSGHPKLDISYDYNESGKTAKVFVKQNQQGKIFKLPVAIDIYQGSDKKRYNVWLENVADTFTFPIVSKPDLINVDGDKILLCEKSDHKTLDNFVFQYKYAGLYVDRREAIDYAAKYQASEPKALDLMKMAVKDKYSGLRIYAIKKLNLVDDSVKKSLASELAYISGNDPEPLVKAAAIEALGRYKDSKFEQLFLKAVDDSSYSVSGKALAALEQVDSTAAISKVRAFSGKHIKGILETSVNNILFIHANESDFDSLAARFDAIPFGNDKFMMLMPFSNYLKKVNNNDNFKKGIDIIMKLHDAVPEQYRSEIDPYINGMILNGLASAKQSKGMTEQADYVKSKLPGKAKNNAADKISPDVLKKYAGEYEISGNVIKVILKDQDILTLSIPGQQDMELTAVSEKKFDIKYMDNFSVEFTTDEKGDTSGLIIKTPQGETKATRKK